MLRGMDFDIIISGAGPAGLCLARALSGHGLRTALIEQQPLAAVEQPAFDGREIALTQHSAQLMRTLSLWERIEASDPNALSPLRDARVLNGPSPFAMVIDHSLGTHSELGWLVSNHLIRRAAFGAVQEAQQTHHDITLLAGEQVAAVHTDDEAAHVSLASGGTLHAKLLVAADSRFSAARRAMGIAADMHDFGRSMLVCMMSHDEPHHHAAWEWFGYGQTLALLPMNDDPVTGAHRSSVVLTLPSHEIDPLLMQEPDTFGQGMAGRFAGRLGNMVLASTRHAYPLVAVYPRRLVARRFACVGDAAVGIHPVTAHGFNFGLLSVDALARSVLAAHAGGRDIASAELLNGYEQIHRRATRPLFLATQLITLLYTRDTLPARALRDVALRIGERFTPFKRLVAASLSGTH
jgi:ubiquinone biosynthesis UbiH/UbiF/VisC/COQ6 family hydroxylase